jgi:hypothetical protein
MTLSKMAIAVALGVLFVATPSATPKGKPTTLVFTAVCGLAASTGSLPADANGDIDTCELTGTGLAAGASYNLIVTNSCGVTDFRTGINTTSSGTLAWSAILYDSLGCEGWTFSLYGVRNALVAQTTASDLG